MTSAFWQALVLNPVSVEFIGQSVNDRSRVLERVPHCFKRAVGNLKVVPQTRVVPGTQPHLRALEVALVAPDAACSPGPHEPTANEATKSKAQLNLWLFET